MSIPTIGDFKTFIGTLLSNVEWNYNLSKIVSILSDGTYDLIINSFTTSSDSSFGGYRAKNIGTPIVSTDAANKAYVDNSTVPQNYIAGLNLSNNSTTPNTDINIATGVAQNSTNTQAMTLAIAFTKRLSTAWSAGTGNGMLDTGAIATSTWYHIFIIAKTDGTTDILASTSATNPLLPSGYTIFRRIGAVKTDGSSNIIGFVQNGDDFYWKTTVLDANYGLAACPTTLTDLIVSAPLNTTLMCCLTMYSNTAADTNVQLKSKVSGTLFKVRQSAYANASYFQLLVDGSRNIQIIASSTNTSYVTLETFGYIDKRGVA